MTPITGNQSRIKKGITSMKNLGKTIARYRKEAKMNQTELAKELEKYDIRIKQNAVSQWESNVSQPSAKQLLAICEIFGIYDIYTEFIGSNPVNPFRNLNEKGIEKVQEYIHLLEKAENTRPQILFPCMSSGKEKFSIQQFRLVPVYFWMVMTMKCSLLLTFRKQLLLGYM